MKYKAFIASTFQDLRQQRQVVSERLRRAGMVVVGMEDWTADPDHPAQLSAKNISGCDICVAIIAFQRGTISTQDEKQRSITQIEIDTARSKGLKILCFVLRNSEQNLKAWPAEFNDLSNDAVIAWRHEFERESTSEFFDSHEIPDVLPAVARQIANLEQTKRTQLYSILATLFLLLGVLTVLVSVSSTTRAWLLKKLHRFHDPVIVSGSTEGEYTFARLLENRADLLNNTDFTKDILATRESFSMFANVFGFYRDHKNEFENIVENGAKLRVVVTDFSDSNRSNWMAFMEATETEKGVEAATTGTAESVREMILELQQRYPDRVELRLNSRPLFFTLWLRDPQLPSGMAHLGIHYYGQKADWPAIRTSRTTGGNHLASAELQFEHIWRNSTPITATDQSDEREPE